MTIVISGKITIPDLICEKCGSIIQSYDPKDMAKCIHCGACYKMQSRVLAGNAVEIQYEFAEFKCTYSKFSDRCDNVCPAPDMFCEAHVSDEEIKAAEQLIAYYDSLVKDASDRLEKINESKKIWMIKVLGGV